MSTVELLGKAGDPIEVAIVQRPMGLENVLEAYATVWAEQIRPRRLPDDPSRVVPDWMNFGGSHYSALIRMRHAAMSLDQLTTLCLSKADPRDGEFLLAVQEHCANFWLHMGAAVDNLGEAFKEAPTLKVKNGKDYIVTKAPYLGYIYNRRTQFIHSRVVPVTVSGGGVGFYFEQLGSPTGELANVSDRTDWRREYSRQDLLDEFCDDAWAKFREAMTGVWWLLRSELCKGGLPLAPQPTEGSIQICRSSASPISNIRLSDQVQGSGLGGEAQSCPWPSGTRPRGTGPSGGWN